MLRPLAGICSDHWTNTNARLRDEIKQKLGCTKTQTQVVTSFNPQSDAGSRETGISIRTPSRLNEEKNYSHMNFAISLISHDRSI